MRWWAMCENCDAQWEGCPDCGSEDVILLNWDEGHDYCCERCRERVGIDMTRYNVVLSVAVDFEVSVPAGSEEEAREIALEDYERMGLLSLLHESECYSESAVDVVDVWELTDDLDPYGDKIEKEVAR